ncbi:MAG TPA: bacillithiol transferase BstA [Bryobacteraceae bacterium]|nr:bacillithiol transferase BstA [Bryobacteraceae bacterium]
MDLRYPIGKFEFPDPITLEMRAQYLEQIEATPALLRQAVKGLDEQQLDSPYRPGGWTVRQVVHHVADSHINIYVRFRLALTEDVPAVKGYDENKWGMLTDAVGGPVETSLRLVECLHQRWMILLRSFSEIDFTRTFRHPAKGILTLESNLALYAWHGRHHVAHITGLRERMGWK